MRHDLSRLSPLPSYSYAIYTVSPPRPLIPVSRGGVQTGKQTGGRVASLPRRCLTTLSMTEHFTFTRFLQCYQHEAAKQWFKKCEWKSHNNVQMHGFTVAERGMCSISLHLTLQMQWHWFKGKDLGSALNSDGALGFLLINFQLMVENTFWHFHYAFHISHCTLVLFVLRHSPVVFTRSSSIYGKLSFSWIYKWHYA